MERRHSSGEWNVSQRDVFISCSRMVSVLAGKSTHEISWDQMRLPTSSTMGYLNPLP